MEVETIKMYKGHRIRAGDQHLIYHFVLGWIIALFIGWMSVFYFHEEGNNSDRSWKIPTDKDKMLFRKKYF